MTIRIRHRVYRLNNMSVNQFEINFAKRLKRLKRRLRTCENPSTRAESATQSIVLKLTEEFDWSTRNPFPIPRNEDQDDAAQQLRAEFIAEREEIKQILQQQLPLDHQMLFSGCFRQPTYHWGLIYDVAALYEFEELDPTYWYRFHLKDSQKSDTKLVELIWLCNFYGIPDETTMSLINEFRDRFSYSPQNTQNTSQTKNVQLPPPASQAPHTIEIVSHPATQAQPPAQMDEMEIDNRAIDSRTLSAVITTISHNKFSGQLEESINLSFTMFNLACKKFNVPESEKVDLLTYAFSGAARNHYILQKSKCKNFFEAEAMMKRTYNSAARQLQVVRSLEQLRYRKYVNENEIKDASEGLKSIVERIELLIPLTPSDYHFESHKISFLKRAIVDQPWAKEPVKNIHALNYDFESFVTALHDSIQGEQELQSARLEGQAESLINHVRNKTKDNKTHLIGHDDRDEEVSNTLLGHFGRNPKYLNRDRHRQQRQRDYGPCRRCNAPWKPGHRCNNREIRNRVRDRFKNGDSHVHIISDLVKSLEASTEEENECDQEPEHNNSSTYLTEFDQLMSEQDHEPNHESEAEQNYYATQIANHFSTDIPTYLNTDSNFRRGVHFPGL